MRERDIPILFYSYVVDGQEYKDDMGRDPEALPRFYAFLNAGKIPATSQLNEYQYEEFLEQRLQKGDVLHIAFGSGMTSSVKNAIRAADMLREKYPNRKIAVIDSLCSSSGYGMLVDCAADMRDRGCTLEETEQWVTENRQNVHHQFFSTDLKYYRRSGRMSGPTAMLGAILNICPIIRLDDQGKIIAYGKVRGKKPLSKRLWTLWRNMRQAVRITVGSAGYATRTAARRLRKRRPRCWSVFHTSAERSRFATLVRSSRPTAVPARSLFSFSATGARPMTGILKNHEEPGQLLPRGQCFG